MSHVVTIKCKLTDKKAIDNAIKRLGGTVVSNVNEYKWWGRHVGDYPLPIGFRVEDMGKCHHKATFPGCTYEVGIIEVSKLDKDHPARSHYKDGEYVVIYDFIHHPLSQVMGGSTASKFVQAYAAEKAKLAVRNQGYSYEEKVEADGSIKLTVNCE